MKKLHNIFMISLGLTAISVQAQEKEHVVQVSGVIVTNDSASQFIPYVVVSAQGRPGNVVSGADGFFSIAALPGDTLVFRHMSFKTQKLWVPDTLRGRQYLSLVAMEWEVYMLDEVVLYPWPTPENFRREFLAMNITTTELDIAQRNLAVQALKERAAAMGYDAAEIQDYAIKHHSYSLYNEGRNYGANGLAAVLGQLSNPLAWRQLFQAIDRGDFNSN